MTTASRKLEHAQRQAPIPEQKQKRKARTKHLQPSLRPKKVQIAPSQIPNAGMGLYILESASKGEFIARYRGEAITQAECARRTGGYRMRVHANLYLDAADEAHFEGRFINDGRRAHRRVNVRFATNYKTNNFISNYPTIQESVIHNKDLMI